MQPTNSIKCTDDDTLCIQDAMTPAIFVVDCAGVLSLVGAKSFEIFGYDPPELLGRNIEVLIPGIRIRLPDGHEDEDGDEDAEIFSGGQPVQKDGAAPKLFGRRKEGTEFPVEFRLFPVQASTGTMFMVVVKDAAKRRCYREALRDQRRFASLSSSVARALVRTGNMRELLQSCAETIVEHLDAAFARIWTVDARGTGLRLQASAGLYTHIDGAHSFIAIDGSRKVGAIAADRKAHLTNDMLNDPGITEKEWAKREGMVAFAGYPLMVGERLVGVMAMFARQPLGDVHLEALRSIADQVALGIEQKQTERAKEIVLLMQEREDFMYTLTHDLKNPLIGANMILDQILAGYFGIITGESAKVLEKLHQSNSNLISLIQNIIEVYRYEKQADELVLVEQNAVELFADCIHDAALSTGGGGIQLKTVCSCTSAKVLADAASIRRVMHNLTDNAIKFSPSQGTVTLSLSADEGFAVMKVHNFGDWIAPEDGEFLFQRFWQGARGKRYPAGSGLGLYLCHKIISAHNGIITCTSDEHAGTTFSVRLPLGRI